VSDFGSAGSEARALFDLVAAGRMTADEARALIEIPADVRKLFKAAAEWDSTLAPLCLGAIEWRERVAQRFETLLANPPVSAPKALKTIQRSGKREVRLPVMRQTPQIRAEAAQDERSQCLGL